MPPAGADVSTPPSRGCNCPVADLRVIFSRPKAGFHERSAASLQRMAKKLMGWNAGGTHDAVMQRLQTKLDGVCARIDAADAAQRSTCENLLRKSGA